VGNGNKEAEMSLFRCEKVFLIMGKRGFNYLIAADVHRITQTFFYFRQDVPRLKKLGFASCIRYLHLQVDSVTQSTYLGFVHPSPT